KYGYSVNAAAGIVGNLDAESAVLPSRVQNSTKVKPLSAPNAAGKTTDFTPEDLRQNSLPGGQPKNVLPPKTGIGLAQWTLPNPRPGLFQPTFEGQELDAMILLNMDGQVESLVSELQKTPAFKRLDKNLTAPGVRLNDASDEVSARPNHPWRPG